MRIRTSVLLAALAAVLSILTPSDAAAACGDCYDTGEGRHFGWETMGDESGWDEGHGWHFYSEPGDCLGNHGLCVIITEEEEEVSPAELTDLLASAVRLGDLRLMGELIRLDAVSFSAARGALQVVTCQGTVAGHIPIDPRLFRTVEAASP